MKSFALIFFFLMPFLMAQRAQAQMDEEWETGRSLDMQCQYSDYTTFHIAHVTINASKEPVYDQAPQPIFKKGEKTPQQSKYRIRSGQQAECLFPTGDQVRVKVGEGQARPYGMCGGDPEVFVSIWVNRRKVASRIQFAGRCLEYNESSIETSFDLSGLHNGGFKVSRCGAARESVLSDGGQTPSRTPTKVCVNYPDTTYFPIDTIEFPPEGKQKQRPGDIEVVSGRHAVCDAAMKELREDFHTFSKYPKQHTALTRPDWDPPSVKLPTELARSSESIFDFDNDGKLDRVLRQLHENAYMDGSVLLVQLGKSAKEIVTSDSILEAASRFLPCQLDNKPYPINLCPTFSQKADNASFYMQGTKTGERVHFRARYTTLSPFHFRKTNYLGVSSTSMDSENYVGVLQPIPGNKYMQMCLFRRVPTNY